MASSECELSNTCDVAIKDEPCVVKPESSEAEETCTDVHKDILLATPQTMAENGAWELDCKMLDIYNIDIKDEPLAVITQNVESDEQLTNYCNLPEYVETTASGPIVPMSNTGIKKYYCDESNVLPVNKSVMHIHQKCRIEKVNLSNINTFDTKSWQSKYLAQKYCLESKRKSYRTVYTGDKSYSCIQCDKCFAHKSSLITHIRSHTGEKPYSCKQCDKCFADKSCLVRHIRIHTGEKPYSCNQCDKCFTEKTSLVNHIRSHTGEKPYSCNQCDKCFAQKTGLVTHMRFHKGEKPYACNQCDKYFTEKTSLVNHIRSHTGERPYSCNQCDKCFAQKNNLVMHMRIHTGEKPYSCSQCDKCFSQKSNLKKHKKIHWTAHTV